MILVELGGALQQAGVQIEHVAGIGLAARRAAQQQRHLAIGDRLLRQIVVNDDRVHAVVAEEFAHRAAGERRQELHRRGVRGGGGDDDRIFERAVLFEHLGELGDRRALLADRDIDAIELLALVAALVEGLLVEDRVERDRGLAGLAVADDQLALAAADRDQRVDRLEAGGHRFVHRAARNDAGGLHVDARALGGVDRALAVDRVAERVDDAPEQLLADGDVDDGARALDRLTFLDLTVRAENDDADVVAFEIERHAARAVLELDHLAGLNLVEAVGARDAVADRQNLAHFGDFGFVAEIGDLALENGGNLSGADIHQPTSFMRVRIALSLVFSEPSTMREPSLTTSPPMIEGSTLAVRSTCLAAGGGAQRFLQRGDVRVGERRGAGDFGARHAAKGVVELAVFGDHVANGEQAPLGGDELDEIGGDAGNAGPLENRAQGLELLVRPKTPGCARGAADPGFRRSWRRKRRGRRRPRRCRGRPWPERTAPTRSAPPLPKRCRPVQPIHCSFTGSAS